MIVKTIGKKVVALTVLITLLIAAVWLSIFILNQLWICSSFLLPFTPLLIVFGFVYRFTPIKYPINYIIRRVFLELYNVLIYRRMFIWEQIYDILCWLIPSTEWKHMNWGYASLSPTGHLVYNLKPEDENERFSIQLYHLMSTGMGMFRSLEGQTLLEVSSGRGGGLDYISRYLSPKKCIGVDISEVQIKYCTSIYGGNQKLSFINGESEKLSKIKELQNEEIDIAINIESGHCYANFKKFVKEVDRILKPGGIFAYSDFRQKHEWQKIEEQLENYSMKIMKKENISENVMKSLQLDEDRKKELLRKRVGPFLRFFFRQMGGVKGSHIYEGLSKGQMVSMAYVLKKPKFD